MGKLVLFWISNFRRVVNLAFFLLGDFPASEFYMPTFRNTVRSIFIRDVGEDEDGPGCSEMSAYKIQTPEKSPKRKNATN
jgi:hypothetical protein